jgi:hypothetical protein
MTAHLVLAIAGTALALRFWRAAAAIVVCVTAVILILGIASAISYISH